MHRTGRDKLKASARAVVADARRQLLVFRRRTVCFERIQMHLVLRGARNAPNLNVVGDVRAALLHFLHGLEMLRILHHQLLVDKVSLWIIRFASG